MSKSGGTAVIERIVLLEKELSFARDRIAEMEMAMGIRFEFPSALELTGVESALLGILVKRDIAYRDQLMTIYDSRSKEQPSDRVIDVHIYKMRGKLARYGIHLLTVHGRGYRIPPEGKAILKRMTEEM